MYIPHEKLINNLSFNYVDYFNGSYSSISYFLFSVYSLYVIYPRYVIIKLKFL